MGHADLSRDSRLPFGTDNCQVVLEEAETPKDSPLFRVKIASRLRALPQVVFLCFEACGTKYRSPGGISPDIKSFSGNYPINWYRSPWNGTALSEDRLVRVGKRIRALGRWLRAWPINATYRYECWSYCITEGYRSLALPPCSSGASTFRSL